MLVFAGAGATHWFDRGGIEEAYRYAPEEWTQIVKPISKKAVLITRPDTAVDMFLRAYRTAITGRPGPVVLQVPFDIQHTLISDTLPDPAAVDAVASAGARSCRRGRSGRAARARESPAHRRGQRRP